MNRRMLAALSLALGVPLTAQNEGKTYDLPPALPAVVWDGALPDNAVFGDPSAIGSRDLNAKDPMLVPFMKLLDVYTKFVEDNLKGFDGSMSQRDAAFQAVNLLLVTGVVWPPTLTAAGAGIGAVALSETGPGALGGGVAGGVVGGAVGTGVMCAQVMLAIAVALEMNEKYPDVATRDLPLARLPLFEDPEAWIAEDLRDASASDAVATRELDGNGPKAVTASATRGAKYAGQWESLFIHLIEECTSPQIDSLARHWTNHPNVPPHLKPQLAQFAGLRPLIEQMAYVRSNGRLTSNSKLAMPLATWQKRVSKLLQGDQAAVQQLWLDCFSIGNTRLDVGSDKITWVTPSALRRVGAPNSFSSPLAAIHSRVQGFGGSMSAALEAGDFKITLGSAAIAGERVRVHFEIGSGRLFDLKVKCELGPGKHEFHATPALRKKLTGHLEFALDGYGLKPTRVSLGQMDLNLGLPALPAMLQPIQGLVQQIENRVVAAAEDLLGQKLGLDRLFGSLDQYVAKRLLDVLNQTSDQFGLAQVERLTGLSLKNGKLEARVEGLEWTAVPSLTGVVKQFGARVQQLAR